MSTENNSRRLQVLGGSNYEIADGQSDIRGWDVKDAQGRYLGEVDELLFDAQSRKVRYLILDLNENELNIYDREILIPIGIAQLHEEGDEIILPNITEEQLKSLPDYDDDIEMNNEMEHRIRSVFSGAGAVPVTTTMIDDSFYGHPSYNDDVLYRRRRGL
jgi:sporulation protein YlmC with PRC-barrel domain